jgi:branched-chain amino acid transport system ATP-binding protein
MPDGQEPSPILAISGLTCRFGGLLAVDNAHFAIERGRILALIGPNGAGKSTTVNLLTGVQAPSAGSILLEGQEIVGFPPHRIVRRGLVRTFQNGRLFRRLNVLENVLVGSETARTTPCCAVPASGTRTAGCARRRSSGCESWVSWIR